MIRWAVIGWLAFAMPAFAECRQALAVGMDVSGSVNAAEYRLQMDGLAAALEDPGVVDAFLSMPDTPVWLNVFEWSGPLSQRVVQDWRAITGPEDIAEVASRLRLAERALVDPSTAIGSAKGFGARLLSQRPGCWRHVLDLSGDGISNTGPRPGSLRPPSITINALVIGNGGAQQDPGIAELTAYFRAYVIDGPQAFIETALGFDDFQDAMTRKLKRELQVLVIGQGDPVADDLPRRQ